jgi:ferrous iron transport protein A
MTAETPSEETASAPCTPLSEVAPGRSATVVEIADPSPAGRRLLDLGFLPGTRIEVVRRAPLGDPTSFSLRGTVFCLRRSQSAQIRVRVLAESE